MPRVFEQLYNRASQRAAAEGRARINRATDTAIAWSRTRPGPLLRLRHRAADRTVLGELRGALGGRCRWAVSGGAPLGERLAHLYRGIGVPVLEGYGLTETAAAASRSTRRPSQSKIGSVGRSAARASRVRISRRRRAAGRAGRSVGEALPPRDPEATVRGPSSDGWLRTGDLGVEDRRRRLPSTSPGAASEVHRHRRRQARSRPPLLEDRLRALPAREPSAVVVGDGRPYIAALVTLDHEALGAWAERHGRPADPERLARDPAVVAEVQIAVDAANLRVSRAEAVRRFRVLPTMWTEDAGQLAPSLKLKRGVVLRQLRTEVELLYPLDGA